MRALRLRLRLRAPLLQRLHDRAPLTVRLHQLRLPLGRARLKLGRHRAHALLPLLVDALRGGEARYQTLLLRDPRAYLRAQPIRRLPLRRQLRSKPLLRIGLDHEELVGEQEERRLGARALVDERRQACRPRRRRRAAPSWPPALAEAAEVGARPAAANGGSSGATTTPCGLASVNGIKLIDAAVRHRAREGAQWSCRIHCLLFGPHTPKQAMGAA